MLTVVGMGPGSFNNMTPAAHQAIENAEVIVAYQYYLQFFEEIIEGKEVISTGMTGEIERCRQAVNVALQGKEVALVSSGDSGIYAMAGLVFEILAAETLELEVKVIPGITASIAGAALLGAPLMNDFCHISLSDLMTPWEMIEKRLHAAAQGDFVICLYNPRSKGRPKHLAKALDIIREYKGGDIVVGIVKDIDREGEQAIITSIDTLDEELVDMTTTVIVGNKYTKVYGDYMYTPRGYDL
ncbi:precorrin-3B C(17)-methyltransferase [Suicoccus acidiformans]|uniref:Precorrin-3B C(17)-methyltransferase n=1 Tax=Suicoccus acidiformans TaxID=2036206 RepID=A0A347WM14_9LACT|nr:precorrin-3B C(17)-methyltransferase [Suicoccus acidiformans]AXY26121.1 precorrin-3B C(17)-methyltransferase [Suicoccus acidiformans]